MTFSCTIILMLVNSPLATLFVCLKSLIICNIPAQNIPDFAVFYDDLRLYNKRVYWYIHTKQASGLKAKTSYHLKTKIFTDRRLTCNRILDEISRDWASIENEADSWQNKVFKFYKMAPKWHGNRVLFTFSENWKKKTLVEARVFDWQKKESPETYGKVKLLPFKAFFWMIHGWGRSREW